MIPHFWVGVINGVGDKNLPLFKKGLPPSHHLIGKSHSIKIDDVTSTGCGLFPLELLNATSKFRN